MQHNFDVFADIVMKGLFIFFAVMITVLIIMFLLVGRRASVISRRQQFDIVWPLLLCWLIVVGSAVKQFLPHLSDSVKLAWLGIEFVILGVIVWNGFRQFKKLPPERQVALRRLLMDTFVKPTRMPLTPDWFRAFHIGLTGHEMPQRKRRPNIGSDIRE